MSQYDELKRLARRVIDIEALDGGEPVGEAWGEFEAVATPAAVLALIAENDSTRKHWQNESNNVQALMAEVLRLNAECEHAKLIGRIAYNFDGYKAVLDERDQLRAEIAGLKTGYQAYERVNAELKAEVGALRGLTETAQKGAELLSKDAGRYRWLLQNWFTMSSEYMGGVSFQTGRSRWSDLPDEAVSEAIDAALGQGEQS